MKFAYIACPYKSFLASIYRAAPALVDSPYSTQHQRIRDELFHWIGAWEEALRPRGYEVHGILVNARPLQKKWADEHGLPWMEIGWQTRVALAQLREIQPDVILMYEATGFGAEFVAAVRSICPNLRCVMGFSASPSGDVGTLAACDLVLTSCETIYRAYIQAGLRCQRFPHAFNSRVARLLPPSTGKSRLVLFCGGIVRAAGYHLDRERTLEELVASNIPMALHCPEYELSWLADAVGTTLKLGLYAAVRAAVRSGIGAATLSRLPHIGRAAKWQHAPLRQINPTLRRHMQPPLYGLAMFRAFAGAMVVLNDHGQICRGFTGNMRLFEATGAGSCLLTDATTDLASFFEPEREVVTYSSPAECVERGRWLLDHPHEAAEIAAAGRARTLRDHTYEKRAELLDHLVKATIDE